MNDLIHPLHSLEQGNWFKLICGASFQHLPAIRNLTLAYALAGADCIDVAADPAVIIATQEALKMAQELATEAVNRGFPCQDRPWLMVSFNDGEDPHFRKAEFNSKQCPTDCLRPCEAICPAQAINFSGVIDQRCYGCGRCLPICPSQLIYTRSYVSTPVTITPLIEEMGIDAIEIHTQVGHETDFSRLWQAIAPSCQQLKVLAISCPDHPQLINYLNFIYDQISPLPCPLIWQTDGRPMSGDIGMGATRAAVKLAQKVLAAQKPGYVQLAGGTNQYTVTKLQTLNLLQGDPNPQSPISNPQSYVSGIAYGSYARSLLSPILEQLETLPQFSAKLENNPDLLWSAVSQAYALVSQLKSSRNQLCSNYLLLNQ